MQQALTNILVNVFARGFYKVHSGLLIFLFVVLISYCFFINTAGDITLLPPGRAVFYNFMLLLTFVSDPIMTGMFFVAWMAYTLKSWGFVSAQLLLPHNQFVYYSSLSSRKLKQFKSWTYMQLIISLPFVFYAIIAAITGAFLHHYFIAVFILLFAVLLIAISGLYYVREVNQLVVAKPNSLTFRVSRYWKKPFFSLFIYHVFDRLKLAYVITKALSGLIIITILFSFADVRHDPRVAGITVLAIVTAHAILIYQEHKFELTYLTLTKNFPYSIGNRYFNYALNYLLLLLPEVIWLFTSFPVFTAVGLLVLSLSLLLLFHCLLYRIGLAMNKYLPWVLCLFIGLFLMMLFGLMWLLIPVALIISFSIFYNNYYKAGLTVSL